MTIRREAASPAIGPSLATEDPNSFSIPSDRLDVEKLARVIGEKYSAIILESNQARQAAENKMAIATAGLKPDEQVQVKTVAARIDIPRLQRLMRATDRKKDPYAPTTSQVILRGIDLALAEHAWAEHPSPVPADYANASKASLQRAEPVNAGRRGNAVDAAVVADGG